MNPGSPTAAIIREDLTADEAPILCCIASGNNIIATITLRLAMTLAEVRSILSSLMSGGDGGPHRVAEAPINVSSSFRDAMQHTPLFPTSFRDFCFAHGAHGATVRASMEAARCVRDMLPRILGTTRPEGEAWSFANLQPPTVVVERRNVAQVSSPTGRSSFVHRRMALAVLYLVPRIEAEEVEEVVRDDAADPLTEAMHLQRFLLPQHRHKFDVALWASALTSWNVAVQDHVGWTLLHHAVFHDHSSAATEILAKCDVDVRSRGGETALHIAVQRHHINMVKLLCGRGANPLAQNHRRNSPLHLSLIHRRAEMVDLLMTNVAACDGWREAVTDCINAEHQSPIHLFQELSPSLLDLCYDGSEDAMSAIDTLVHHPLFLTNATSAARQNDDDDDDDDVANEDALHFAAAYGGSASVMRYLYSRSEYHPSSSRTPLNELKQTPLHIAAGRGHLDCVKIIATTSSQQLMCRDRNGATPLLEALRRRRYAVAEWLLSEEVVRDGASHTDVCVGAVDHLGNAALHYACGAGHIKLVKVLVERHHADVRLKCGVECSTCLPFVSAERYASRRQREHDDDEMMMMKHGCFTPLRCATRARPFREELVAYLCNNGGVVGEEEARDALDALITHGFFHLAEEVLANLPHEMSSALEDNSLLLRFCSRKNSAAIAWCIAHRLATLHTTMGGDPVRASAAVGDEWAINFLVEAGASANAGSSRQDSALCEAIVRNQHAAVGALMRHGARLSGDDFSALSVAVELLHDDIITGLLGAQTVEPADVAQSLVELLSRPYACADRCGRRGHNRHQRTRRVARRLARHYDASQSLHVVHPTMLLHLAASTSMFEVVEELLDGLARLPEITRAEVLMGGVAAPVKVPRPPLAQRQHRRHQQHPEKKDEHVVVLRPIKERRDAYSYCAAHNQLLIAHRLWREAGVVPWEVADNSGRSCTDYAMERGSVEMLQLLCTLGIFPRRVSRGKRGPLMEALQAAGGIPLTVRRACATEVVAMLIAQQHPPLLIQSMLRCITDGAPEMMSVSTADVESWVLVCVRAKRLDALRIIRTWWEDSQAMRFASEALDRLGCLMAAVDVGDCEMARYLLELQCSPNALAPMPISCYVQHRVGWKLGKEECATPLCLAAWRQDARMLALLANAAPVDGPSYMDREKVRRDAIKALIVAPNPTLCASIRDAQTANLIRTFARHGHPLSSSASVREAAARGWCATVRALLDCYGAEPSFIHFLLERGSSHVLPAAYYMAVNPTMFGWLRDMLVATDDAHGLLHLTDLAMHLMKQVQPRPTILEYAMQHGHDEAAIFFMAHGFPSHHTFFKVSSRRSSRSTLGPLLQLTLAATQKHMIKAAGVPAATRYLQAAMLLGFGEVVHRLADAVEGFSTSTSDVMVPTLLPMALSHAHGWDQFACVLQRHPLLQLPTLQPSDMFCIISRLGLCPSLITMCSRAEVRSALKETTSIWLVDGHEVWRRRSSLMPRRTSMLLTRGASLAWAIALGKEEWVRYLVSLEPQLLHGCTASLAKVPGNMAWGPANIFPYGVELNGFRGHEAEEIAVSDCEESSVDVCVLAMLMLAECRHEKTGRHLRQRAIMLQLLQQIMTASACSWSSATLNVLAIAAAKMAEWDVLAAIMRVADATLAKDEAHYFRSVDEEEVPPAMAVVVQDCRHVMQAVAAAGSCDVVMEVFERSKREDVEQAGDAKHRTAVYWAMAHPRTTAVKVFLQLQVNLELSCCRSHHRTPLMMACRRGRTQVVMMMLKARVPLALNAQDKEGCTALMCAAERGCGRLVKELLAAKADASLLNASGMSAAMLAALGGHDELAQLLMDVPHAAPLEGATTTMLHAAAVGGCWLTAEKAIQRFRGASLMLKKDASGATALTVAHAFGSTRVLHIMKAALPADAFTPFRCHDFLEACQPAQVAPRRKKLRWSATAKMPKTEFGWFRAIMTLNAALARCETSPDELQQQQQQQQQHELRSHVPASTDLLTWCVEADDVVGMRVLGEMGVMDEDGAALLAAAKLGRTSIAEVLLLHHMSPSNVADHHGLPPYAVAALHRHPNTARMMLLHTQEAHLVPRTEVNTDVAEAARERLNTSSSAAHDAGSNGGTTTEGHGVFSFAHVLASSCNGELLELLCQRLTPGSMSSARLLQQLQKPAENGLMAMEYAAAVGGPSALIRTARALQQLSQAHVDPSRPTKAGEGKLLPASASITTFLLAESSFLSPAVRVLLLEVFGVALALDLAPRPLTRDNRRRRGRLTMADVRLIGTNALERTDDCVAIMRHFMTVAREEAALRQTLPDYGSRVCLDLSALESCTAMQKRALLQWMGTSVMREVVGACCPRRGVRRAEKVVVVATTRGVGGATTFRPHGGVVSLLVHIPPSNSYLVMPTIQWPAVLQERRTKRMQEVQALCDEATALLQAMPFPPFQAAVVDVEWSRPITHTDEEPLFDGTCDRLVAAVKDVRDYFRHELHAMAENEANMDAVKAFWQRQYPAGGRRTAAGVRFLHVEDAHAFVPAEVDAPQGSTMGTIAFGHDGVPGWRGALQRSLERCLQSSLHRYHIQAEVDAFCLGLEEVLHRHDVASTNTRQYPTTITNEESVELPALHRLLTELKSAVVWLLGLQQGRLWSKTSDGRMFGRGEAWGCGLPTLRTIIARTLPTLLRDVRVEVGKVEDRVEVNANGLTLCGGAISTLGRDEMIAILSAAAVRAETEKLRMELPSIMASCQRRWKEAMGTSVRLQMQGLEMPNLAEDAPPCDHEEVLAAFTLLTSHESAKVLHPLVDGLVELDGSTAGLFREVVEEVSVHWDAHCCSAYCNMHVEPKPDAGLAIQLSIYYPLQCAEMGSLGWSRLQLLSKTQVRYLVMAHLASVPAVVAKMAGSLDTATLKAIRHVCSGRLHPPPVHQHWQRDSVATPTTHEEPPATPTTHEEPLATPTIHEEPLATPTIHEEPLATPTTHEEPPAAAAEVA